MVARKLGRRWQNPRNSNEWIYRKDMVACAVWRAHCPCAPARTPILHPLHDREPAQTVDQIDQPARIDGHVVALHAVAACGDIGHEMRDLARRMGIGDVDDAQAVGEPGEWDLG